MTKIHSKAIFKSYNQQQSLLLPPSLEELIDSSHLVRVVNDVVERMDLGSLINQYEGGGTSSYHPKMMLKVLLYAYSMKIYTGRKIARALSQDIHFMWLSGMARPDFRTINNFRSGKAKDVIEDLFKEVLLFLMDHNYIKMENYFCDGSTFSADGNRHKMVWKKNAERYKEAAVKQCNELFQQIEQLNNIEEKQYGKKDLEETGVYATITPEHIEKQIEHLNKTIVETTDKKVRRKAESLKKKVQEGTDKIAKYDEQIKTAKNRSGYHKTDEDATAMMMKNKVEVLPAYNVMAGSEEQFITGVTIHQNPNDGTCLKDHLMETKRQQPQQPKCIIADGIFGTEQNYELLEKEGIENLMKFPLYHKEQKKVYKENKFLKDNFNYDSEADEYTCPHEKKLIHKRTSTQTHPKTGYMSTIKEYECIDCSGCPFYQQCCKSEKERNRTLKVNERLEVYKQQARENLKSERGAELRRKRSIEIESCFGDIKHNMGFRRFHLRGKLKVKTEITLVAMAHNLRKLHIKQQKKVA